MFDDMLKHDEVKSIQFWAPITPPSPGPGTASTQDGFQGIEYSHNLCASLGV